MRTIYRLMLLACCIPQICTGEEPVDFARDIYPILQRHCVDCHGEDLQEGKLRLDAKALLLHGGVSGPAVLAERPRESLLLRRILGQGDQDRMPLDADPLSKQETALIERWIATGANWPEGVGPEIAPPAKHWSLVAPVRGLLPQVKAREWVYNPIDAFILAKLEEQNWAPSPDAEKLQLLRRVSLDLIGLPPTPQEMQDFLADDSPQAYEKVVDRLLASPAYGERWARPWLDLARYADSNGYQADQFRSVWPYRDWVIESIRADMPFDQFTIEQIAGDLLENATVSQKVATGFNRLTTCNVEAGVDPEENRVNQVIDRVNTTATTWLGATLECAQCHNHKYDPFTQRDYYRLFAYFNNTPLEVAGGDTITYNFTGPKMPLPLTPLQLQQKAELEAKIAALSAEAKEHADSAGRELEAWAKTLADTEKHPWRTLTVEKFHSQGGASHEILADGSVLIGGERPGTDVYTIDASTEIEGITAIRLETLTDPSLPGQGPGRHHPQRPNFVLNEFTVTALSKITEKPSTVVFQSAAADYAQASFPVAAAVDGKPDTGWAIHTEFHKPHEAIFYTKELVGKAGGTNLIFMMDQRHGECRTIGRFRLSVRTGPVLKESLPGAILQIASLEPSKRSSQQQKELEDYYQRSDPKIADLKKEIAELEKEIAEIKPVDTLVMVENTPRKTHVFKRGEFLKPGEEVQPGTPLALPPPAENAPANRLGLARWIASRDNPLTARVAVNRWWGEIFGKGIVATPEDFGSQGEPPTHPELLDWLAVELMESGWSRKKIHRLIVLSHTYRQSSRITPAALEFDPENNWLARAPRLRLSAETIRDAALRSAGLLSEKSGGPPVFPPQPENIWRHVGRNAPKYATSQNEDRFRRGIYVFWRRSAHYPSFSNFDAPDRASCTVNRPRTNTPLQALTLLNDPAYVEITAALALRIAGHGQDDTARIDHAIQLCLCREAKEAERTLLRDVLNRERERLRKDPKAARALLGKTEIGELEPADAAACWFLANILLNLDEAITKG